MTQKVSKKAYLETPKTLGVHRPRYCQDCEHSRQHSTGSQIWLSCKFQEGWRSVNSVCNLPEKEKSINE